MTISTTCQFCNHHLQVPDSYAGQTGPCPNCNNSIQIPKPSHSRPSDFHTIPLAASPTPPSTRISLPVQAIEPNNIARRQQLEAAFQQLRQSDPLFAPQTALALARGELLGEGGMGAVYRVHDDRLRRDAALKVLSSATLSDTAVPRFLREARLMARLDHPAIPPVYETGTTTEGEHFLLMRLIRGQTLSQKIQSLHKSPVNQRDQNNLLEVLIKVSEALAYAHSQKIIHRDLKPDNIMVGEFGEVMVMDWGLARDLNESEDLASQSIDRETDFNQKLAARGLTIVGAIMGTPGYMPPEQANGESVDERADIFALGAILTEILTNEAPVSGNSVEVLLFSTIDGRIKTPREIRREIRRDIPRELNSIAASALAFKAADRTASAQDFSQDLRAWLAGERVSSHRYSLLEKILRSARKNTALLISSTLFATLVALAGSLWASLEQQKRYALETRDKFIRVARARKQAEAEKIKLGLKLTEAEVAENQANEAALKARRVLDLFNQTRDLLRRGAPSDSIQTIIEKALADSGRSYDSLLTASNIFGEAQLKEQQIKLLDEAVDRYPPAYQALFALHTIEVTQSERQSFRFTDALQKLLQTARTRHDENEFTLFAEAVDATNAADYTKSIQLYSKIEKYASRWSWPISNRANLYKKLGNSTSALEDYNKAIEVDPRDSQALNNRGSLRSELGDRDGALSDWNKAIEVDPRCALAFCNRADLRSSLGDTNGALQDYNKAIELNPTDSAVFNNRGALLSNIGNKSSAHEDFNKAIEINPRFAKAYFNRATTHHSPRAILAALEDYNKAIEIHPQYADAYNNRGFLRRQMNDKAGALSDFDKAIEFNPKLTEAYINRATLRRELGDSPKALLDYSKAIEIDPACAHAYVFRGMLRQQSGDSSSAIRDFDKAIELDSASTLAYLHRGRLLSDQNRNKEALRDLQKFLELSPNHRSSQQVRQIIAKILQTQSENQ